MFLQATLHVAQRDQWLIPAAGDDREVVQVLQQFLIFRDWQDNGSCLAVFHHVLSLGIQDAHGPQLKAPEFQTQPRGLWADGLGSARAAFSVIGGARGAFVMSNP